MRRPAGFTLIELLVVIAIILILAAIAVPVLARAAAQAREVKCVSNIRQCAQAMVSYANGHDGMFPCCYDERGWGLSWTERTWREKILDYLGGSKEVLKCPARSQWPAGHPGKPSWSVYGCNAYVAIWLPGVEAPGSGERNFGGQVKFQHMDDIDNTSETILLGENKDGDWSLEAAGSPWWDGVSFDHGPAYNYHPRQRGAYAMADTSTRMMTFTTSHENDLFLWKVHKKTDPPRN